MPFLDAYSYENIIVHFLCILLCFVDSVYSEYQHNKKLLMFQENCDQCRLHFNSVNFTANALSKFTTSKDLIICFESCFR